MALQQLSTRRILPSRRKWNFKHRRRCIDKNRNGQSDLSGTNTYPGATTIQSGILEIASDASLGLSTAPLIFNTASSILKANGTVTSNRPVAIDGVTATFDTQNFTVTIENGISSTGGGALTKIGAGNLILSGTNTYPGATTINAGRLDIYSPAGSITSATTVNSGGTLGGNGTITGSVIVNAGGAITPGPSIDTLSIIGSLTLMDDSTTNIEVSPTTSSVIAVTGMASVAGTLNVIPNPGKYIPKTTVTFYC